MGVKLGQYRLVINEPPFLHLNNPVKFGKVSESRVALIQVRVQLIVIMLH